MKVLHVNTYDRSGGAARAVQRLHTSLQKQEGIESIKYVRRRKSSDPDVHVFEPSRHITSRFRRFVRRKQLGWSQRWYEQQREGGAGLFTDDRSSFGADSIAQMPSSDIVHLHWIRHFIDVATFFDRIRSPVVWTLHDMNPFTGGCHYSWDCERYKTVCGSCPVLGSTTEHDLSRQVWKRKKKVFGALPHDALHLVASSRYMAECVQESSLLGYMPITVIPLALDTDTFQPRQTDAMRKALGLARDTKVVLFIAANATDPNKGFDILDDALLNVERKSNLALVTVGDEGPDCHVSTTHIHLGRIEDGRLLSLIYSMADVLVNPSRQEAFSQTTMEAMACGTPVIGSNTGGIPDMVCPGETGWLIEVGDTRALRAAIEQALSDDAVRARMGRRCRAVVEKEYALDVQARRYKKLYAKCLDR